MPTGATVSVAPDPTVSGHSTISVFRSRPIDNTDLSLTGARASTSELPIDTGFPRQSVAALFTVNQTGKLSQTGTFTILVSSSGYASVVAGYAYVPGSTLLSVDPACSESGTSIVASSADRAETHAFDCSNATYEASVPG
jgi:hypothetical protein